MKHFISFFFVLLMAVLLTVSSSADFSSLTGTLPNIPDETTYVAETATPAEDPANDSNSGNASDTVVYDDYVMDLADILTDSQEQTLSATARDISERMNCGVYIGTINDMANYGFTNIELCAEKFYTSFDLGVGNEKTGILLLLSMAGRDYDLAAYGSYGHYSFTDYGKDQLENSFLDNFRQNDWYGGFSDYLAGCDSMLSLSSQGTPVDIPEPERITGIGSAVSAVIGAIAALILCAVLKSNMKNVHIAKNADEYIPAGSVRFRTRNDYLTHRTQSRQHIQRSSGGGGGGGGHSGGTTVHSSGFSHSSGKF